jgi:hypothetical protein
MAHLPTTVIEATRDWAFGYSAGEWIPTAEIADFIRSELGYTGTTPQQYAARFVARGVANRDFETRLNGREWQWIVHPQPTGRA